MTATNNGVEIKAIAKAWGREYSLCGQSSDRVSLTISRRRTNSLTIIWRIQIPLALRASLPVCWQRRTIFSQWMVTKKAADNKTYFHSERKGQACDWHAYEAITGSTRQPHVVARLHKRRAGRWAAVPHPGCDGSVRPTLP